MTRHVSLPAAGILVVFVLATQGVSAAPLLTDAEVIVTMTSATSCDVKARFTIEGAGGDAIEHRIQALEGVSVELREAGDAVPRLDVVRRGATLATVVPGTGDGRTYDLRYRVTSSDEWAYRCPIWLPAVPTDGRTRPVRLEVHLPPGGAPLGSSLPAFAWTGTRGTATTGHLPSFVRVPHATADYAPQGRAAMDLSRFMDVTALAVLSGATALWIWRRHRTRRSAAHPDRVGRRETRGV